MIKSASIFLFLIGLNHPFFTVAQTANFNSPDTVCITQPVNITNTSTGASSYYWNFCVADILNTPPVGENLGNPGNFLSYPVFSDFVEVNGNFYVFVVNNNIGTVIRLDFGNSLLNTPSAVNLGNFGGVLGIHTEGIQIVSEGGQWYGFIVAGDKDLGDIPQIVKVAFGTNIANNTPIATNWGNIGNMNQPLDLFMFKDNANWYGFTVDKEGNVIRFNFGANFNNPPGFNKYTNLGLSYPTGVNVVTDNGKWYAFVTTATDNGMTRLDFGNSLLNTPVAAHLGNPGNVLNSPRDIYVMKFCDAIVGFATNGGANGDAQDIVRLNFSNNLEGIPSGISLGNIGNFSFPHSLSKLFRVGDQVYTFITNVSNNTITRLQFPNCTNSSIPSFNGQNPPSIRYNTPGVYNINLTIDDGLPSQSSYCRQVVVVPEPTHTPTRTITLYDGESIKIGSGNPSKTYEWNTGASTDSIVTSSEGTYTVKTSGYGCENIDTIIVKRQAVNSVSFNIPDTVCVTQSINIINTSAGASSYYWNFCVADINKTPTGVNLGNIGGLFAAPVFMDYVFYNNNYYGFLTDHNPGALIRLDFGNSLLNTPTTVNLGNFGGIIPVGPGAEGIQMVNNEGKWYAIIVGGYDPEGSTPRILKVDFGPDPTNISPIATNWGNIGNMYQPIDLHVFKEGNNWFGLTVNAENNTLTRFNFTNSFDNVPTGTNLGNIGGQFAYPTGVYAIENNGDWKVFVVNGGDRTRSSGTYSLVRLDFGSSLLNTPTAVSLGNPGSLLQHPRDISIVKSCDQIIGFAVNGHFNNSDIIKYDFGNDLSAVPQAASLGNIGNLSFPHSISKLFREGDNLYSFVTNSDNNTIVRLQFSGCTNSSVQSSIAQNPPSIKYDTPGTYHINLTIDDGLPSQSSYCRQVVVVGPPQVQTNNDTLICGSNAVQLNTIGNATTYSWTPAVGLSDPAIKNPVATPSVSSQYIVTGTSAPGCNASDTVNISIENLLSIKTNNDTLICESKSIQLNTSGNLASYFWTPSAGLSNSAVSNPIATPQLTTQYIVTGTAADGCSGKDTVTITVNARPIVGITTDTVICKNTSAQLYALASGSLSYQWSPATTLNNAFIHNPIAMPGVNTIYKVVVTDVTTGCFNTDSVSVDIRPYPIFSATPDTGICEKADIMLHASGGDNYQWSPSGSLDNAQSANPVANPVSATQYAVHITDETCNYDTLINVNIDVRPAPTVMAQKSNDINCVATTAQLNATGADSYLWTPAAHLDNETRPNPVASIDSTTTFIVQGTTQYGCSSKDSITVKVTAEGNPLYMVPNAFTPNNDGINDCVSLKKWGNIQLQEFSIYNRWGERVFHTNNPMACWDGVFKGQPQNIGTFVYVIRAKTFCGTVSRKGLITLIR